MPTLDKRELLRSLALRDLTAPEEGPHALQLVVDQVVEGLGSTWGCDVLRVRASPIVTTADNYDALGYPAEGAARDARYTRYVGEGALLRTQTSAMVPPTLRALARGAWSGDVLVVCPGIVYRRDQIDRLHTGEPHQLDLWRVRRGAALTEVDLDEMIELVVRRALPGRSWRTQPASHPYTRAGRQIDVPSGADWVEIGECGLAAEAVLTGCGLAAADASGLAMGLGLDRLLMLAKGVDDIRLLRSEEPRVARQMLDLAPYRPVSRLPAVRRDLSLAVWGPIDEMSLGDRVRSALGDDAEVVEEVTLVDETPGDRLSEEAAARLGLRPGQTNALVRLVLRPLVRTLTHAECNALRDRVYAALHEGTAWTWATADGSPRPTTGRGPRGPGKLGA